MRGFRVVSSTPGMAEALEEVQRACFPTLAEGERITAAQYRKHLKVFPEGQFAVLSDQGEVVACSTDLRTTIDFEHFEHRYIDAVGGNWLSTHDPKGDWLYGADIGVKPAYRGMGLSRLLYAARHDLVRRLNLRGHVAGGMLSGYGQVKDQMSASDYFYNPTWLRAVCFSPSQSTCFRIARPMRIGSFWQVGLSN
jgi:GNAT superfamily N-acetyltransferase